MASMRDIKRRKESIQSTGQITKAMKLVATVKLQKAKGRALDTKPYFDTMYRTVTSMILRSENLDHPFLTGNGSSKRAYILISSNRGLAGGYNSNIVKLVAGAADRENSVIYPVGRKGKETMARLGYEMGTDYSEVMNAPLFSDAAAMGTEVLNAYLRGEIGEIYLVYTSFKNTVSHIPKIEKLLPIRREDFGEGMDEPDTFMNFEPEPEAALDMIIPKYINSLIYGGLVQAFASENGARMQAMDSATSNAEDMIADLSLKYNRARQSSITQELTEIIAGASAIG